MKRKSNEEVTETRKPSLRSNMQKDMEKISAKEFYAEYHGHKIQHLQQIYTKLRSTSDQIIFLAGDSSLDNKYWFNDRNPAVGVYKEILSPPSSICDVNYWLNQISEQQNKSNAKKVSAINTAVEATTINQRTFGLLPQDEFIRDNITSNDVLIVSIGGNDVAMSPTPSTICSMAGLLCLPTACVKYGKKCFTCPCNDYCFGCGTSTLSCLGSFPPCLGYFNHLFGTRVQNYIKRLVQKQRPKKILVCMIYYPDETVTDSWAGAALKAMGYDSNPQKLQMFIRKMFTDATSQIQIDGCEVIPVPLFHVLDGKNTNDYCYRVEPSPSGGKKMAEYLLNVIENPSYDASRENYAAPSSLLIGRY